MAKGRTTKIYKFASVATTTTAAAASIVIQKDCHIVAITWQGHAIGDAAGEGFKDELSLSQTAQHTTNDTSGVVDSFSVVVNAIGGGHGTKVVSGVAFPLREGERLNINRLAVGTPTTACVNCFVHVIE